MRILSVGILLTCTLVAAPQLKAPQPRVDVRFVPAADEFAAAVREYEQIWVADGVRITGTIHHLLRGPTRLPVTWGA